MAPRIVKSQMEGYWEKIGPDVDKENRNKQTYHQDMQHMGQQI